MTNNAISSIEPFEGRLSSSFSRSCGSWRGPDGVAGHFEATAVQPTTRDSHPRSVEFTHGVITVLTRPEGCELHRTPLTYADCRQKGSKVNDNPFATITFPSPAPKTWHVPRWEFEGPVRHLVDLSQIFFSLHRKINAEVL